MKKRPADIITKANLKRTENALINLFEKTDALHFRMLLIEHLILLNRISQGIPKNRKYVVNNSDYVRG